MLCMRARLSYMARSSAAQSACDRALRCWARARTTSDASEALMRNWQPIVEAINPRCDLSSGIISTANEGLCVRT